MYIHQHETLGRIVPSRRDGRAATETAEHRALGQATAPSGPITVAALAGGLTNLVLRERNPSLRGQRLTPGSNAAAVWKKILGEEVKPALRHWSPSWNITQLIFFSRHPNVSGRFKQQPSDQQRQLWREFENIRDTIVRPWLSLQIARGSVKSRTIFVVDNDAFRSLPWETRNVIGDEIAKQFEFVNGNAPMTVIVLDPGRFPEAFNFSDAVVSVTDPNTPPQVHVYWALRQQVNNLNRALAALGSRQRFPAPDRTQFSPDRYGLASMNKFVTPATQGTVVAAPLMASAVNVNELVDFLNKEHVPSDKDKIPRDRNQWSDGQKKLVGLALGRAMAHEVRHLYIPGHAADGLGSAGARLFGQDSTFSVADRTAIQSSMTALEGRQGTRAVAASFAAAERTLDFPF